MNLHRISQYPGRGEDPLELLEAHLQRRLNGRVRDFQIVTCTDGLILKGCARTYYEKQLAQHAVMEATLTPILSNEIEVRNNSFAR